MTEPDAKLRLGKASHFSSEHKFKGIIETSSVTVYNREEIEDQEPLFSASTIEKKIEKVWNDFNPQELPREDLNGARKMKEALKEEFQEGDSE